MGCASSTELDSHAPRVLRPGKGAASPEAMLQLRYEATRKQQAIPSSAGVGHQPDAHDDDSAPATPRATHANPLQEVYRTLSVARLGIVDPSKLSPGLRPVQPQHPASPPFAFDFADPNNATGMHASNRRRAAGLPVPYPGAATEGDAHNTNDDNGDDGSLFSFEEASSAVLTPTPSDHWVPLIVVDCAATP